MNITYLDADTREVIKFADYPTSEINEADVGQKAKKFADLLGAAIVKLSPLPDADEGTVELKIPLDVRHEHTPLPGDRLRFPARVGVHGHEVTGVYQFNRRQSYVILDDGGGEWEVQTL